MSAQVNSTEKRPEGSGHDGRIDRKAASVHDEDRPTHRLSGNLHGTYETKALAQWLRKLVGDRSTHMLHDAFPYSPGESQWNDILSGRKLISLTQLTGLVNYLVPDQTRRQAYLHDGAQLMEAAERAEAARRAARSKSRTAPGNTGPTVRRRVVSALPTDGADNNSETAEEEPLAVPEGNKPQDHGAAPSAGGTGTSPAVVQPGGHGRGPRIALIGTACLALLAGGGWLTWDHLNENGQNSGTSGTTATSPVPDESLKRLSEAREGKRKFKIGVKRKQGGLSEYKNGDWVGMEIEYAKAVVQAMGLEEGEYEFRDSSTENRAASLNGPERDSRVDIFVGTYGISKDREAGKDGNNPPVLFAGPYFTTPQSVMLQRYKKSKSAQIGGESVKDVKTLRDALNHGAQVCVVAESRAQRYMEEKYPNTILEKESDYNSCVTKLKDDYDALLADSTILNEFQKRNTEDYIIAPDQLPYLHDENYGIGLGKDSFSLRHEVCKAMKKVTKKRNEIYGNLAKEVDRKLPSVKGC
ncbi:transporter substrate-binding domain-containing protein [Streptomyces sp. BE147]|uniref:transporter substrate-binding domain-containing protein n=1 Tax=Streptomyces sp. BE147 TaxID=3002524 RepID=UPI002E7A1317|nr:transporter substrate-binding domain-containing protein [Streptomyces sp. BE147]MEE1735120.1 transporter substrate-binding domain-containing protein [Streptomyces sp. BE147]